jgi:glycosyltransferase involved in cell wall biosynthesis
MANILLVNKFYYPRGGDCTAVSATEKLLKEHGHRVAVFSMQYPKNDPTPWETYFPSEISFGSKRLTGKISAAIRPFHSPEVAGKFKKLLHDFRPDAVHLHNIHSYLSPVVAQVAHREGIRVVWTMHDYKLICPSYACLRDGAPCELCYRHKSNVIARRCMNNSRAASLLAWMEALYWNRKKLERITDRFVSPSAFLKERMVSAGFRDEKISVLHNFMYRQMPLPDGKDDYYCYVGRLSAEKGLNVLLEAAARLPYPLKIVGDGPLSATLREKYASPRIEFTGHLPTDRLIPIVRRARFLVMPSVWYENNPFSVIESLCLGTPVLGAKIGGIPELIDAGVSGLLFEPGDADDLKNRIRQMSETAFHYGEIARQAQTDFSGLNHYKSLMEIYTK